MHVVLVHWRIKPDQQNIQAFLKHWREENKIEDRSGLVAEFLSESISPKDFPDTTWHLDPENLGDHKSFVNVALWREAKDFDEQIARHYNDKKEMKSFEKYRRRRVVAEAGDWRIGQFPLAKRDSKGVL
jgi:hypothetical protein